MRWPVTLSADFPRHSAGVGSEREGEAVAASSWAPSAARAITEAVARAGQRFRTDQRLSAMVSTGVVFAVLLGYLALSLYLVQRQTRPMRLPDVSTPTQYGLAYRTVVFPSRFDRVMLHGWLIPAGTAPAAKSRLIIVLHARWTNRTYPGLGFLSLQRDLVRAGYSVLAFDLRAHGDSPGQFNSQGYYERRDVLGAYDFAHTRGYLPRHIGFVGFSLGAVSELLAAPDLPGVAGFVSVDAPVDDGTIFYVVGTSHGQVRLTFPQWLMAPGVHLMARLGYGIDLSAVACDAAVRRAGPGQRYLFVHDAADTVVAVDSLRRLLTAAQAAGADGQAWTVTGGGHAVAYVENPTVFIDHVTAFFAPAIG